MGYSIYKLPHYVYKDGSIGKIGCSSHIEGRISKYNSFEQKDYEILETHNDIYIASDREQELQIQNGYRVDRVPYHITYSIAQSAGIKAGNNAVSSGQFGNRRAKGLQTANHSTYTCPHCNKEGQLRAMKRWHGDNCPQKK